MDNLHTFQYQHGWEPLRADKGFMKASASNDIGAIWRAVDIVCDAPTLLIVEAAWLGTRRFDGFLETTGLFKTVVSARLKKLVDVGIFKKHRYCDRPPRFEYLFTDMGLDLFPVALMMLRWEKRWSSSKGRITVALTHTECGQSTEPYCACRACLGQVSAADIQRKAGPSAELGAGSYVKRRRQAGLAKSQAAPTALFEDISDIFGDRWAALILRAAFMGERRYDAFLALTGASTNILADRLKRLQEKGLFERVAYQENPARYEYRLTEKALDIYPVLLFLLDWGERWFANDLGPSVYLTHQACGEALAPVPCCSACGQPVERSTLTLAIAHPKKTS